MRQTKTSEWLCKLKNKRMLAVFFASIVICFSILAQERTFTGIVIDEKGIPLFGATIVLKGTTTGTTTDQDGAFSIDVPGNDAVLTFSFIGYLTEEITVSDKESVTMSLVPDITSMEEIVVIGYGAQKKKLVTGATVQIKNEDFVRNNATRLESALQGLTPGMAIIKQSGQPGSEYNISIRGLSSINGNTPLILIDGVPGDLNTLNPSDIETVDVLKDAASAAIYGSRAASGVILITTKKGKAGAPVISYDAYYGISNPLKKVDMLNAKEYAMIMNEEFTNRGRLPVFSQGYIDSLDEGTDWQEEAYNRNAPSHNHYLGISGGNDISTYSLSLSYSEEAGIFDFESKSRYERFGFRINSEHKMKSYLTIGENLTYTHRYRRGLGVTNVYNNFVRDILQANPIMKAYDPDVWDGFGRSAFNSDQINPIASMHYNYNEKEKHDDIIGNVYAELEIIKGLKFRTDFGGRLEFENTSEAKDTFRLTPSTYQAIPEYRQKMSRVFSYNFDNVLYYETNIGDHNVLALVGVNVQDTRYFEMEGRAFGLLSNEAPVLTNATSLDTAIITGDFGIRDSRYSQFGRVSWNYREKYMSTVSLRRDGSSRFGKDNRFGIFPSFSAGWAISEEDFLEPVSWLGYLKLRASWGQNGKEPARRYVYMARVGSDDRYYTFGNREVGISPIISANPSLKWEASEQWDIGFDSRFLEHFRLTFDWYKKTTKDWIMQTTVPGISGIAGISSEMPFINGGNVKNSGVEFALGYVKNFGNLFLDINANMAYNKNEVTDVPGEVIHGVTNHLYNGAPEIYRIEEGFPLGYFWGYRTGGIFQTQEEIDNYIGLYNRSMQYGARPGDVKRFDENGDSLINANDKVMIGDPNPDFLFGFSIAASYKGFDFSMNIQGQAGNQNVMAYRDESRFYYNYTTAILDRWQWIDKNDNGEIDPGEGTSNTMPRVTLGTETNQNWRRFSDLYIHNADFIKIKSINIGYDLVSLFENIPIQQFRIYFSATNLLTITKYEGLDPEVGYGSYYDSEGELRDAYASGVDIGFYPTARTYLVGVNVKF